MKPLKLTISAFGSFADAQTVDFTELGDNGLYLITGDTGSGKTTIFDAISFALFGKASGDGRNDYQMLRSDFADEKAKTFVELDFICGESTYNIKRTIKKNGQDVVIVLPDGTSLSGDRKIKSKITEIVGLDRDQFAQIVMIAQNDFLRFLQSGTDERLKIMRRIFGTEALKYFQERLKSLVKGENDKRALILHDFERYEVDVYRRDEYFSEWETQIMADKAELSGASGQLDIYDKKKQTLAAGIAVAEGLCRKFSDLAKCRIDYEAHMERAEEISEMGRRASRGETALRRIKPLADEAKKAGDNHISAQTDLKNATDSEAYAIAELEDAVKTFESLPPLDEAQDAFANLSKEWETSVNELKNLTVLQTNRCDIADKQNLLSKEQLEFETINAEYTKADNTYSKMEEAFLRSQAGILASGLEDGAPCPVCGSTNHPKPAVLSGGNTSEAKLKKAKDLRDKAQVKRETKSSRCGSISVEIETLKKRFLVDLSVYISSAEWEPSENALAELLTKTETVARELTSKKETDKKTLDEHAINWDTAIKRKAAAESAVLSARTLTVERTANEQKLLKVRSEAQTAYANGLRDNNFTDDKEYALSLITEKELSKLKKQLSDYEKNGEQLTRDIARLESETAGKKTPDIENLKIEAETVRKESELLNRKRDELSNRLNRTESALLELRSAAGNFEKVEKSYASIKQLADTANGKLDFETFAQMAYFERVLYAANLRLQLMSQNRYALSRKTESDDGRKRSGLELEVLDAYTGKARSANSLSGGESFMVSLSLALGLSDIVQQNAGGIRLDAMFIDEGFGSLDAEVLELAVRTLSEMAGANRTIGIISHVSELRERIEKQIQVDKTITGSKIR